MMRLSFFGSTGSLCPTYSSRLPLPLVSMMRGVQPCDFASSPVSRYILVLSQPTTPLAGPPALVHSVWLASFAKYRWCVEKQVLMSFHSPVLGSYIDRCRGESLSGAIFADGGRPPSPGSSTRAWRDRGRDASPASRYSSPDRGPARGRCSLRAIRRSSR